MLARLCASILLCTTATAQTQVDWSSSLPSIPGWVHSVCFDVPGRTIYSATTSTSSGVQGSLTSVDSQGVVVWTVPTQFGSMPVSIRSLAYDGNGHIAAAWLAPTTASTFEGAGLIVYDLQGNAVWSTSWTGPAGELWSRVAIAGFVNGGPVLVGIYPSTSSFTDDLAAIAFDASGIERWRNSPSTPGVYEVLADTALDGSGDLYVVGEAFSLPGGAFVLKITASGAIAWSRTAVADVYNTVAVDAQGRPYLGGSRDTTRMLIARIDPMTGQELFAHTMSGDAQSWVIAIAIGQNGDVVATGTRFIYVLGVGYHVFTIALDPSGTELWRAAHRASLPSSGAYARAIDVDEHGDVVVAGYEFDSSHHDRPTLVKYSRAIAPTPTWVSRDEPVAGSTASYATGVRIDSNGDVRVAGSVDAGGQQSACVWQLGPYMATACVGDGSAGACPCGNESTVFEHAGCRHSFGLGSRLESSGTPSIAADTFRLWATELPTATLALFLQGAGSASTATAFGDGIACLNAPIVRLGIAVQAQGDVALHPAPFSTISAEGSITIPGTVHTYQARYRNSAPFCTSAGWNSTNAIEVTWRP